MVKLQVGMASLSPISLGLLLCSAISLSLQAPFITQVSRLNEAAAPSIDISLSKVSTTQELEVTYPSRVDDQGNHVSYNLGSAKRNSRDIAEDPEHETLYFRVNAFERDFILNVSANLEFISKNMIVEYVGEGGLKVQQPIDSDDCHHTGHILGAGGSPEGWVAISNCRGLHGVIATTSGYYFIEPVEDADRAGSRQAAGQRHVIYKTPVHDQDSGPSCTRAQEVPQESREVPPVRSKGDGRLRRNVVTERYIETAIVADRTMLEKHGRKNLESYLYSLMNVVSHLYKDPSIGHALRVLLVKTIILETDQPGLSVSSDAHGSLVSFCQWQRSLNDGRSPNHDVAVLVTHRNICETGGTNCGTLGMAKQGGVCNPAKSCNINEDSGLRTAFTIAHEMGHNLNLHHDGNPMLQCKLKENYLMAPSFADSANPHHWSHCSRVQLEEFLSSPASECLDNSPSSGPFTAFSGSPPLPGMEYSFLEQCRLLLGPNASHCPGMHALVCGSLSCREPGTFSHDECRLLWCKVDGGRCAHQYSPPAPGTECTLTSGVSGVCYQGECVDYASVLVPVDGGWGEWGPWTKCSRSCGTGVQYSERECNSPLPANGGSYCLGPWRRYQTCETHECPGKTVEDYRQELCESDPPHNRYREWEAPSLNHIFWFKLDPCKHHCLPKGMIMPFTKAQLQDGAPCITPVDHAYSLVDHSQSDRTPYRGVCIDGGCVPVGCDGDLYGKAHRDKCGVWCGNGTSCHHLSGQYSNINNSEFYIYYEAVTIPEGSASIHIKLTETTAEDFIAAETGDYFLNGNWEVVSDSLKEYWFAGTMWFYEKPLNAPGYLRTEGPTKQSVTIYLLTRTLGAGLHYSFSVPKENLFSLLDTSEVLYSWDTVGGECEGVCGEGVRRREVRCVKVDKRSDTTVVDDAYCDPGVRPAEVEACPLEPCRWATEQWTECDAVCGEGSQNRTVLCQIRNQDGTYTTVEDKQCDPDTRPPDTQTCSLGSCSWVVSPWTECDAFCGEGSQSRSIGCQKQNRNGTLLSIPVTHCEEASRPSETQSCQAEPCHHFQWVASEWSECDVECGDGSQTRTIHCQHQNGTTVPDHFCSWREKPNTTSRTCSTSKKCPPPTTTATECVNTETEFFCAVIARIRLCRMYRNVCCKSCAEA